MKLLFSGMMILASLGACNDTANMVVSKSVTDQGYINQSNVELGDIYLWYEGSSTRLDKIGNVPLTSKYYRTGRGRRDLTVSVERDVGFGGSVELSEVGQAALKAEVAKRTKIETSNVRLENFTFPRNALVEAVNITCQAVDAPERHIGCQNP